MRDLIYITRPVAEMDTSEERSAAWESLCQRTVEVLGLGDHGFDVFLSHNSKDKPVVRELAQALQQRGVKIWLDEWKLAPGQPWQPALEKIIAEARSVAVLFRPSGLGPWEEPEMRACLDEFVRRKLPVIPVLLPGASHEPVLPLFLKQFTWVDLRDGLTPAGVDRLQWGVTGRNVGQPVGTRPVQSAPVPSTSPSQSGNQLSAIPSSGALLIWREKLAYLEEQEAVTADPAQKFALKKHIEEARTKIHGLEG